MNTLTLLNFSRSPAISIGVYPQFVRNKLNAPFSLIVFSIDEFLALPPLVGAILSLRFNLRRAWIALQSPQ
jgi:hypothetical protein